MKFKSVLIIIGITLIFAVGSAYACYMKGKVSWGDGYGGECSNNNKSVTCSYISGLGWHCIGPAGEFFGENKDDMDGAVNKACGCN